MPNNYSVVYGWLDKKYTSPAGCDEVPDYSYVKEKVIDKDVSGKKVGEHEEIVFMCTGAHSQKEYINSFRSTTELKEIFKRYMAGDTSVLEKRVGDYMDTVGCPESLLDAQLMLKNGEVLWNQLPSDVKEKYDNDVEKFINAAISGKLYEDFNIDKSKLADSEAAVKKAEETAKAQADEISRLNAQIAELQKGVKYE